MRRCPVCIFEARAVFDQGHETLEGGSGYEGPWLAIDMEEREDPQTWPGERHRHYIIVVDCDITSAVDGESFQIMKHVKRLQRGRRQFLFRTRMQKDYIDVDEGGMGALILEGLEEVTEVHATRLFVSCDVDCLQIWVLYCPQKDSGRSCGGRP